MLDIRMWHTVKITIKSFNIFYDIIIIKKFLFKGKV